MPRVCEHNISELNFACEIRGSEVLGWESSHFIGSGQIQFASYEEIGTIKNSEINSNVRANLTGNEMRNGVRVISSNLSISVSSVSLLRQSLIVCLNTGLNTRDSTEVQVTGVYL